MKSPLEAPTGTCPVCARAGVPVRQEGPRKGRLTLHKWPDNSIRCHYAGPSVEAGGVATPPLSGSREKIAFARDKQTALASVDPPPHTVPDVVADLKSAAIGELDTGAALDRAGELASWWRKAADAEIDMVVDKAIEYGATDLRDLGRQIYEMSGRPQPDDATAAEAGIAFYVMGKMSRVAAAFREGRLPSSDTWLDIGVYSRMAQRVRQAGAWPGV